MVWFLGGSQPLPRLHPSAQDLMLSLETLSIQEIISSFMIVAILFKPCYFCYYFTPLINLGGRKGNGILFLSQIEDQ